MNDPFFAGEEAPVVIQDRAWISSNVTVLPGVTVAEGAVLAAGAVATKNCDAFSIYGGIPAKKINERGRNLQYCFPGSAPWFW